MTAPEFIVDRVVEIRPEEVFISYDLPLKPDCERALKAYVDRYTDGDGNPLEPFYTDSLVTLHIPRTLKLKVGTNAKSLADKAQEVLRLSDNGGRNGISN